MRGDVVMDQGGVDAGGDPLRFRPFPDGGDHHDLPRAKTFDLSGKVFGRVAGAEQHALAQGGVFKSQSHAHFTSRLVDAVDGGEVRGPDG